jgi:hypothetical protein
VRPPLNNIRPYTIKNWRPPVPEPLPPAPLLGPKELLGLGLLVLAQIWGLWRKRERLKPTGTQPLQVKGANDTYAVTTTYINEATELRRCSDGALVQAASYAATPSTVNQTGFGVQFTPADVTARSICGPGTSNRVQVDIGEFRTFKADGTLNAPTYRVAGAESGDTYNATNSRTFRKRVQLDKITLNGVDLTPYTWGEPVPTPDVEPEILKPPALPPLITPVRPAPQQPEPETRPEVAPVEPGPKRPPTTTPRPPVFRPIRPVSPTGTKDGAIVPKPADPVVVTDPDWHFPIPGGGPITGNGPQAKPEEIAKELGRLEQKLNAMLNPTPDTPIEWQKLLQQVLEALLNGLNSTTYTLTEDCNPGNDPNYTPRSWDFQAPGALSAFGVIENRLDALAKMVDQSLRAKQQICLPTRARPVGELVTARFRSVAPSPNSSRALRKELRYRDNAGRPEADHVAHWLGFEWMAGPAIVRSRGAAWGEVCVWAADPAEGRRVIAHAAAIAGVDLSVKEHRWFDQIARDSRTGQPGVMKVEHDHRGTPCISKRVGPSGTPGWMRDP